jgi:hypothetical protein
VVETEPAPSPKTIRTPDSASTLPLVPVPRCPGTFASADGSLWSARRSAGKTGPPRRVGLYRDNKGYYQAQIPQDGRRAVERVHRLIARAFLGECPPGNQVRHLDGNPANNNVSNLSYGTRLENREDAIRHGTCRIGVFGERAAGARLSALDVAFIRAWMALGFRCLVVAQVFGISACYANQIACGRRRRRG